MYVWACSVCRRVRTLVEAKLSAALCGTSENLVFRARSHSQIGCFTPSMRSVSRMLWNCLICRCDCEPLAGTFLSASYRILEATSRPWHARFVVGSRRLIVGLRGRLRARWVERWVAVAINLWLRLILRLGSAFPLPRGSRRLSY